jgi:hypothetical protein
MSRGNYRASEASITSVSAFRGARAADHNIERPERTPECQLEHELADRDTGLRVDRGRACS